MKLEEKQRITEEIAGELRDAGTIYLTDFTGLDVGAMTAFRDRLSEEGLRYRVVKNTLMRRALEGLELPDIEAYLEGPTGLVLGGDDPVVPAKAVREFAKEHEERPVVKVGIIDRRTVTPEEVGALAELPPRDALLGSIAGSLTAGVSGIVGMLAGVIRDIAYMVEEVAKRRGEGPGSGVEPPADESAASADEPEAEA